MQKISSIIPSSDRVSKVDFKESGSVRPGAVSFGRPMGTSALSEDKYMSSIDIGIEGMTPRDRRKFERAQIVNDVSAGFFMHKRLPKPENTYNQNMEVFNSNTRPQIYSKMAEGVNYANVDDSIGEPMQDEMGTSSAEADQDFSYAGEHLDVKV